MAYHAGVELILKMNQNYNLSALTVMYDIELWNMESTACSFLYVIIKQCSKLHQYLSRIALIIAKSDVEMFSRNLEMLI